MQYFSSAENPCPIPVKLLSMFKGIWGISSWSQSWQPEGVCPPLLEHHPLHMVKLLLTCVADCHTTQFGHRMTTGNGIIGWMGRTVQCSRVPISRWQSLAEPGIDPNIGTSLTYYRFKIETEGNISHFLLSLIADHTCLTEILILNLFHELQ